MPTIVDTLYTEHQEVLAYLDSQKEISLKATLIGKLTKVLVISAASYFEFQITGAITKFTVAGAKGNGAIISLVKQKAIDRQYHTYFNWDQSSANKFLSLFGEEFKTRVAAKIQADGTLSTGVSAFIELGLMRNQLAHMNFASLSLEKTSEEVYVLYQSAQHFVDFIEVEISACV